MAEDVTVPTLSAGAVVSRRNDLLVVRHHTGAIEGRWSVPTAKVRRGEMLVEASVRAVGEDTGLPAVAGPFLGWYESLASDPAVEDGHRITMCFGAVVLDDGEPVPGGDLVDARWMPVWDVSELPLVDGLVELLAENGVIDTLS